MKRLQMDSGPTGAGYSWNLLESPRLQGKGPTPGAVIMHIALQGCLKAGPIRYGLTADTGGHIRYLLELVDALSLCPEVSHQIIVTRAFDDPRLGKDYQRLEERLGEHATLWRCQGASSSYLPKEALWQELPYLVDALTHRIQRTGIRPDLIHAHYADAGVMALRLKAALGIPYVFTAHSLGATKARHRSGNAPINRELKRRIRFEELSIKGADQLIASSEHEATIQYAMYRNHDALRTQVNPPGCNLDLFRQPASEELASQVDAQLRRFLRRPERPCLLAIARPVEKKNLCALVQAYGENPELREQANLVIYAGTRQDLASGEAEACQVWQQLIRLIDQYDLYGDVAYPKQHELSHVPAIYQWAARRHGVFVNPALNEPFGLTLLEAAAAGLPVVATQEGGPVDIIGRCQHGLLIPPTQTCAIADACHRLLTDKVAWQRHSTHGRRNVSYYSWARHANQYIRDTARLRVAPTALEERPLNQLLATDMDGTLLGQREGLVRLRSWLAQNRQCLFVVATGRSAHEALRELEAWSAPRPDVLIADVGSTIYTLDAYEGPPQPMTDWRPQLDKDWQRAECRKLLDADAALVPQPDDTQSTYKLSYFIRDSDETGMTARAVVTRVEQTLAAAGQSARVVFSHGHLLDVLPPGGGKARAVEFVRRRYGVSAQRVVAAGDSGNDIDLLRHAALGIVVANHTNELEALQDHGTIYWARSECAAGIMEGLHFGSQLGNGVPGNRVQSSDPDYHRTHLQSCLENSTSEIKAGV